MQVRLHQCASRESCWSLSSPCDGRTPRQPHSSFVLCIFLVPKVLTSIYNLSKGPADIPGKKHSTLNNSRHLRWQVPGGQEPWKKPQIIWSFFALLTSKGRLSAEVQCSCGSPSLRKLSKVCLGKAINGNSRQDPVYHRVCAIVELPWRGEKWKSGRQLSNGLSCGSRVLLCWRTTVSLSLLHGVVFSCQCYF